MSERRLALLIGNGDYKDAPLKNPVNDARDMHAALKTLGFDATLLLDATMQQMEKAVREFGSKLRQGGTGLFYYAGHGLQLEGNNYLIPVSAVIESKSDVRFGCLDAGLVLGKMEDADNGLNIIILDACRENPFRSILRGPERGLAKMDAPTGSLIAYACAPGTSANDGEGKNGLYTQHLLQNIGTPGLIVEEMFKRVRQGVAKDSGKKQVPWEESSLIGHFSFMADRSVAERPAVVVDASLPSITTQPTQSPPNVPYPKFLLSARWLSLPWFRIVALSVFMSVMVFRPFYTFLVKTSKPEMGEAAPNVVTIPIAQSVPPKAPATPSAHSTSSGFVTNLKDQIRVALVIGNSAYRNGHLKNPVNDAHLIADTLKKLGFYVLLKTDIGKKEMDAAVAWLNGAVMRGGVGVFYFAGHGISMASTHYIAPVDANINTENDVRYSFVSVDSVLNGTYAPEEKALGRIEVYASEQSKNAEDGVGVNSPFTQSLAEELLKPKVEIQEIIRRVRDRVKKMTNGRQTPVSISSALVKYEPSSSVPLPSGLLGILIIDSSRSNPFQVQGSR